MMTPESTLAVVLGAQAWPDFPGLQASTSFANSARRFVEYLRAESGLSLPAPNVCDLFDDGRSPADILKAVAVFLDERQAELRSAGRPATDLLLYVVGHGGFVPPDDQYCLFLRYVSERHQLTTGLAISHLGEVLREQARFLRRYVIIDACFAAGAADVFQSSAGTTLRDQTFDALPRTGTALLCSSSRSHRSKAPAGQSFTMFTGALLEVLSSGQPEACARLSLRQVAGLTADLIHKNYARSAVRPEVHSPNQFDGDVADVPLFPNNTASTRPRIEWHRPPQRQATGGRRMLQPAVGFAVLGLAAVLAVSLSRTTGDARRNHAIPRPATAGAVDEGSLSTPQPPAGPSRSLTVAEEGGDFKTIGEALEAATGGARIRVRPRSQPYREYVAIDRQSQAGVVIEADGLVELSPPPDRPAVSIASVPNVTVRGFCIRATSAQPLVAVTGRSPGLLLDNLTCICTPSTCAGIMIYDQDVRDGDDPLVVQDCKICGGERGVMLSGVDSTQRFLAPVGRICLRGNLIDGAKFGIVACYSVQQVQVVGNVVLSAGESGIQLVDLREGVCEVLIANNTMFRNNISLSLFDDRFKPCKGASIRVCGNLSLESRYQDFSYIDGETGSEGLGTGDGRALAEAWLFAHNWREVNPAVAAEQTPGWVPPAMTDTIRERFEGLNRSAPDDPSFLRPPSGMPLATGGAGPDLPSYSWGEVAGRKTVVGLVEHLESVRPAVTALGLNFGSGETASQGRTCDHGFGHAQRRGLHHDRGRLPAGPSGANG